ncbi:hypothetical protein Bca101_017899 [Brassica carinata]
MFVVVVLMIGVDGGVGCFYGGGISLKLYRRWHFKTDVYVNKANSSLSVSLSLVILWLSFFKEERNGLLREVL